MRALWIVVLIAAGCGASDAGIGPNDAGNNCTVFISFDPPAPTLGMSVRAIANVANVNGLPAFEWTVKRHDTNADVSFTPGAANDSAVIFDPPVAGAYDVAVNLTMSSNACPFAQAQVNVLNDNTPGTKYRLRVLASGAPPQEKTIQIPKGLTSYAFGGDALAAGTPITAMVTHGAARMPAYVRITPMPAPDESIEAYSDGMGVFHATVTSDLQTVLVIPASTTLAPRTFTTDFSTSQAFDVDAGAAISGIVKAPGGTGLAGAHVQLTVGGVPSTLAQTAADGTFTVQAVTPTPSASDIAIDVTPPSASGLPRLSASGTFDATKSFSIAYASLTLRDLAGAQVMRGAAAVPNATVTLVGTVSGAGQINVNGTMASATGAIHVTAMTNASGILPSLKAPALGVSAVIQVAAGDLAVASVDLSTAPPATIQALANVMARPEVDDFNNQPLAGVTVDAVPVGDLALAGAQPIRATSDVNGAVAFALAAGGKYDFRLHDPQTRVAPSVVANVASASVPASLAMLAATIVSGDVEINGSGPAANAVVQLLCFSCGGVERTRPIVEVTTDASGHYHYPAVKLP